MSPTMAELMAALPAEEPASATPRSDERLRDLFEQLATRPAPTGALHRAWTLGGLQAKLALAYLAYVVRTWFGAPEAKQRQLLETNLRAALWTLEAMGYLRGAVMKVGQALATFPEILPAEFADLLASLHFEAPPMHFGLLREYVENELGRDPEDVFRSFEPEAFAAASLGQVHRAWLPSGEPVAVKIQYPGIAGTIRADVGNLRRLMLPLRLSKDWESLSDQFAEVQGILESETDYEREAAALEEARGALRDDDGVVVPRVYREYSTGRVLTMEYIDGESLTSFLARDPSQELRNKFGERIMRASARLYFSRRLLYSDFHPGNVLFCPDGRLGFIDFGGLRRFNDDEWALLKESDEAMRSGDRARVLAYIQRSLMFSDEEMAARSDAIDVVEKWAEFYWAPWRADGTFDFGDSAYFGQSITLWKDAMRTRVLRQQPMNVFIHRCMHELTSLLYRLRARVNYRAIYNEEVGAAGWGE